MNINDLRYQFKLCFFRSSKMCSEDELLDDLHDELIPKTEPFDVDFIKTEEFEEDSFVAPGILESFEVDKDSVKEEAFVNEGIEPCLESSVVEEEEEASSSSNVRIFLLKILCFSFKDHISTLTFSDKPMYLKNQILDIVGSSEDGYIY